ncbi:type IV pilus inner membrane component PilO [Teredinibacter purpureus]|uniref:type 4a pilus biogenesis protein PilO n=1 Tax=Teredinibacter purpureus TaxID=2731756 RepID=UPI0005F7DD55|nr:type 4a pilus biogenesis protein PilO [Teredinibacter purpureus]
MADMNQLIEQLQGFDINDVDWDRVGVWPVAVRVLLCFFAAAAIVVAGYFLVVQEKNHELDIAKNKEVQLKTSFETKAFEAANLDRYRQQMLEMKESFGTLVSRLPTDTEVPGLLEDIDNKGVESRLSIQSIALQNEVSTEFYIELPIKINVSGGYHEFGAFVSGVAGMPRIVTLHNFRISKPSSSSGAGLTNSTLTMEIIAKTYRYKSQGS